MNRLIQHTGAKTAKHAEEGLDRRLCGSHLLIEEYRDYPILLLHNTH